MLRLPLTLLLEASEDLARGVGDSGGREVRIEPRGTILKFLLLRW
jgi:hypothetical protein